VKREQLEHILRAASRIVDERDFLVAGSAAVLGTFGDEELPYEATRSDEAGKGYEFVSAMRASWTWQSWPSGSSCFPATERSPHISRRPGPG
jgi:hypothetical protein